MRLGVMLLAFFCTAATAAPPAAVDPHVKPRLIVLTDIGNEPDDQMSLVRLLLYSNEIDIEGIVATTSTWQKERIQPKIIRDAIAAYGQVRGNLLKHAPGWPTAQQLLEGVAEGVPGYGMAAIDPAGVSQGAALIMKRNDPNEPRPLWIAVWGGANTLAEYVRGLRHHPDAALREQLISQLRVYSISDQDDAGPWIRREVPGLFYIAKPSPPNAEEYASATWTGISGDVYYRNGAGADGSLVTNEWLDEHVRKVGPLGKHYPRFEFIMEGDTPSFLNLIDNGLASAGNPSWGGWGGRYVYRQPYGETRPLWTQGGDSFARVTSADTVLGVDGKTHVSDHATIWRWRRAFQHDFAARMQWTVKEFADANHAPAVVVNGVAGKAPLIIDVEAGKPLTLDATGTRDPDGDTLSYRWFHYAEAGFVPGQALAQVSFSDATSARAEVTVTEPCRPVWLPSNDPCRGGVAHVILEVTDNGEPALTSYRRVVVKAVPGVQNAAGVKNAD